MTTYRADQRVHLQMRVSLSDLAFIPGDPGFCPIAERLKEDPDIEWARVDDQKVAFSRVSTGQRYWYRTPANAVRFIHAVDAIMQTQTAPADFTLTLTDQDLIKVKDRGGNGQSVVSASERGDIVSVSKDGKVTVVHPQRKVEAKGHRPKREVTLPA